MNEDISKDVVVETTKEVVKNVYKDTIHPTLKTVGNILSLPFKALDAALTPLKKWIDQKNYNYEKTRILLAEKLQDVKESKIVEPEAYVAVPALRQLEYSYDSEELRELYANLLVSAMNEDKKWSVHPSYVDIIKQLSPIDAQALNLLQEKALYTIVCISIRFDNGNSFSDVAVDFSIDLLNLYKNEKLEAASLQNLQRLGLINIRYDQFVQPISSYDVYINTDLYQKAFSAATSYPNCRVELKKGLIELTNFGSTFCDICCNSK